MSYVPVDWEKAVRRECKRRRYSERTAKTYVYCINRFLNFTNKELGKISKKDVRLFLEDLSEKERSGNTMNTYHMAIRFLFENVLEKRMWIDIKYSKVPERIQKSLSKEEVKMLIGKIENWKHRLMIELMYGAGLRVSELINLRVKDLVLNEGYGFVRSGKGNKDRLFILAKVVSEKLENLIEMEKLEGENFVFQSNRGGKYNVRSLQQIIKRAARAAKLDWKEIHPHTLRHSFATHLVERGNSVSDVQSLLGHKSPETTFTYLHNSAGKMVGIKSPLDD